MVSDDRETDWAPKQIEKLNQAIADLKTIMDRRSELCEHNAELFTDEMADLKARITNQAKTLASHREQMKHHSLKLERVDGFDLERMTNQITKVENRNAVIAGRLVEVESRVKRDEDDARIQELERRTKVLIESGVESSRLINQLSEAVQGLLNKVEWVQNTTGEATTRIEARLDTLVNSFAYRFVQIEARLVAYGVPEAEDKIPQFGAPWASESDGTQGGVVIVDDGDFSPPIGSGYGVMGDLNLISGNRDEVRHGGLFETPVKVSDETKDRITGAKAVRHEAYDRGFSSGKQAALAGAERRVRAKLEQMGWAPGSPAMLGVVNALRYTEPIKDNPQA